MRTRLTTFTAIALALTATMATATHYPNVGGATRKKDRAALTALQRLSYAFSEHRELGPGMCDCMELTCDPGSFMLACGGEIEPFNAGELTAARRTSRETCYVCGCGWVTATLRATPVCAGF